MKKLKAAIQYECITSLKYICVYYLALGAVLAVYFTISHLLEFKFWNICLEMNTMILVGIIGILHLQEDFRMLLQNGFTRTCIFLAAIVHFAFIAGMLSMVDTAAGIVLRRLLPGSYDTIFGSLYGYHHQIVSGWLWLFLVYLLISSLGFFFALAFGRMQKKFSVFAGTILVALFVVGIPSLFAAVSAPWEDLRHRVLSFAVRCFGFMADDTVRLANPIFLMFLCIGILSAGSYLFIRRIELNRTAGKTSCLSL